VRRTNQRTRHNGKSQFLGVLGVRNELLRANPTLNWVEPRTRTQVLRNGDDVRAYRAHIAQSFLNLFLSLTHAQDQVGLGDQTEVVCLLQNIQRTLITECRADTLENTRNGFQVVSEDLRASLEDFLQQVWLAGEVRGEVFYTRVRVLLVDLANHFSIKPCTLIWKVITGNTGNGGVVQIHLLDVFCNATWLIGVQCLRLTSSNIAEVTTASTTVTADEEGSFSGLPAFVDIRTARLLADSVQASASNTLFHVLITRASADLVADPPRLLLNG